MDGFTVNKEGTGIDRFGRELLKALDEIVDTNQIVLLVPEYVDLEFEFKHIVVKKKGRTRPFIWQQTTLVSYVKAKKKYGYKCLSITNTFPILLNDGFVFIHDISPIVNKNYYSRKFRLKTNWQTALLMKKKKLEIFTISNFTKNEIMRVFGRHADMAVVPCGWEHILNIPSDSEFWSKHNNIKKGEYFFAMSSVSPNKNFRWILEAAKFNQDMQFIIAGKMDTNIFGGKEVISGNNILFLGYITDSEAKCLMENAKAFVFPSFYEGFGIPPLEALACGTQIIISDIPCLKAIYGDSAHYIDPNNPNIDLNMLLRTPVKNREAVLETNTWENAALRIAVQLNLKLCTDQIV